MNETSELLRVIAERLAPGLDISRAKGVDNTKDYPKALAAAEGIENIENDWGYQHTGEERKFGQKVVGETIKLWSLPRTSAEVLEQMVVASGSKNIVEVGTSAGYSTIYLAMGAKYNSGHVTTIENLVIKAEFARKNFESSGLDNIKLVEGDAKDILKQIEDEAIDFIFLDADKESYGAYFDLIIPKLRVGGYIVADNVFDYGHMMQDYLSKVLGTKLPGSSSDPRVLSYTLPIDNGLLITKKVSD